MPHADRDGTGNRPAVARVDDMPDPAAVFQDQVPLGAAAGGDRTRREGQFEHGGAAPCGVRDAHRPRTVGRLPGDRHLPAEIDAPGSRPAPLGLADAVERLALAEAPGVQRHRGVTGDGARLRIEGQMPEAGDGQGLLQLLVVRLTAPSAQPPHGDESAHGRIECPARRRVPTGDAIQKAAHGRGHRQRLSDRPPVHRAQDTVFPPRAQLAFGALHHADHPFQLRQPGLPIRRLGHERGKGAHQEDRALDAHRLLGVGGRRGAGADRKAEEQQPGDPPARSEPCHGATRAGFGSGAATGRRGIRSNRQPLTRWMP